MDLRTRKDHLVGNFGCWFQIFGRFLKILKISAIFSQKWLFEKYLNKWGSELEGFGCFRYFCLKCLKITHTLRILKNGLQIRIQCLKLPTRWSFEVYVLELIVGLIVILLSGVHPLKMLVGSLLGCTTLQILLIGVHPTENFGGQPVGMHPTENSAQWGAPHWKFWWAAGWGAPQWKFCSVGCTPMKIQTSVGQWDRGVCIRS